MRYLRSCNWIGVLAVASLATACSPSGQAVVQPEIVKTRQANFKSFSAANKALKAEFEKPSPSADVVAKNLAPMITHGAQITTWFPDNTQEGTEALPAIWEKPAEFAAKAKTFNTAVATLQAATATGDMASARAAFEKVGPSCKGCHDTFRQKK